VILRFGSESWRMLIDQEPGRKGLSGDLQFLSGS
jgi:hypothetical protein